LLTEQMDTTTPHGELLFSLFGALAPYERALTLLEKVSSALVRSGLTPERLELEITESALLADTDNVLATLHALRALGVKISMDDFGTGYSSLSYLQKFPFNKIKIDRSFVSGGDADSEAILRAVSGLGSNLGMAITAEGVETADQLRRIRDQRCTHVQGYLTGRPMAQIRLLIFCPGKSKEPRCQRPSTGWCTTARTICRPKARASHLKSRLSWKRAVRTI
jgi:EAL domain-containing protein (putative c-di-GMP-specific phosphodiesterase class I)